MIKTNKPITYDDFVSMTPKEFDNFNIDIDLYTDEELYQVIQILEQLKQKSKNLPIDLIMEENITQKEIFKKYEI